MRGGGAAAPGSGTTGGRRNFAGKRQTGAARLRLVRGLHLRVAEDKANSSGDSGGGLGYGRGIPSLGADGDQVAHGGEILRHKNKGKRAREDCSPHCKTLAKGRAAEV
jgi:hypothetical protein